MKLSGKRIAAAGAVLALALTGAAVSASIASANDVQGLIGPGGEGDSDPGYRRCPDDHVCFWEDSNYQGGYWFSNYSIPNVDWFNDKMTSVWNRTNCTIVLFEDADGGGKFRYVWAGQSYPAVEFDKDFNDKMSSYNVAC